MATGKEMVLYYTPCRTDKVRLLKGVLVRLGVRIKNVEPGQAEETVGYLLGMPGYPAREKAPADDERMIPREMLVLYNFTGRRLDQLLQELRRAKASVALKAVATGTNCGWTFLELYEELVKEHEAMHGGQTDPET